MPGESYQVTTVMAHGAKDSHPSPPQISEPQSMRYSEMIVVLSYSERVRERGWSF